ncbi:hypothetical protein [Nonomuraea fuscirosea]
MNAMEQAGALKGRLVDFAPSSQFAREMRKAFKLSNRPRADPATG